MLKTKDIVLICDDNYCLPTVVCVQSIIDNIIKDSFQITIHICTFGLTDENVFKLESLSTERIRVVVDLFNSFQYEEKLNKISQKSHVTPTALIKFEIPNYFSNIDSLLYLDSDMVVKGNLTELLNIELGDSYLGATYEFYTHINAISYSLKRTVSKDFYFNSGMMLLNLQAMRHDGVPNKLWYYKLNKAKSTLMDQESLNAVCSSNAIHLPIKWNFNPIFLEKCYIGEINKVYGTSYADIKQLEDDVCILHYVGSTDKPWNYKAANLRNYWDKYYRKIYADRVINFKEPEIINRTYVRAMIDKIRKNGFWGFLCNILYIISCKIKNVR